MLDQRSMNSAGSGGSLTSMSSPPDGYRPTGPAPTPRPAPMSWMDLLRAYYEELNRPLDMNDPRVAAILNGAYTRAAGDAAARGIGGPMAMTGAQQSYIGAAAGLDQQRRAMGLQALQTGIAGYNQGQQLNLETGRLALDRANTQYQNDFQRWLAQTQMGMGAGGTAGSLIGGGLGAAAGMVLGGPAGAMTGAGIGGNMGNSIGRALGGGSTGPAPSFQGKMAPMSGPTGSSWRNV